MQVKKSEIAADSNEGNELKLRKVKLQFISIIFLSIYIGGCTLDYALPANETMRLSVYKSGQPVYERKLGTDDGPLRQAINRWLAANPLGWEYAFITREPHIYLTGKNFSVNILETEVSVKYFRGFFNCHFWVKKNNTLFLEVQNITQTRS